MWFWFYTNQTLYCKQYSSYIGFYDTNSLIRFIYLYINDTLYFINQYINIIYLVFNLCSYSVFVCVCVYIIRIFMKYLEYIINRKYIYTRCKINISIIYYIILMCTSHLISMRIVYNLHIVYITVYNILKY